MKIGKVGIIKDEIKETINIIILQVTMVQDFTISRTPTIHTFAKEILWDNFLLSSTQIGKPQALEYNDSNSEIWSDNCEEWRMFVKIKSENKTK